MTREDARELYAIVGHLEAFASTFVAALAARERGTLADELAAFNGELHAIASRQPHPRRVFDIDKAFHAAIVAAAGGGRLAVLHQAITPQVERYWRLYASSIITELHLSVAEHEAIIRGRARRRRGHCGRTPAELGRRVRADQSPDRGVRRRGSW